MYPTEAAGSFPVISLTVHSVGQYYFRITINYLFWSIYFQDLRRVKKQNKVICASFLESALSNSSISVPSVLEFDGAKIIQYTAHCTEVRFSSFFFGGFITATVVNPSEKKLAKRTFVHCTLQCRILPMNHTVTVFFVDMTLVKFGMSQQN